MKKIKGVTLIQPPEQKAQVQERAREEPRQASLRFATLSDIPRLLEIAEELYIGSPIEKIGINMDKIKKSLEIALVDQRKFLAVVSVKQIEGEEVVVGALVAYVFEPIFTDNKIACELLMWLDPDHRQGRRGYELMQAYEYWAKLLGCKVAQYGFMENSPPRMEKLYQKTGAFYAEKTYFKPLG